MGLVAFISDLHYPNDKMHNILGLLDRAQPDALVLAGDSVNYANPNLVHKLLRLLDKRAPARIALVLGNHEHYLSRNMLRKGRDSLYARGVIVEAFQQAGIPVLDEEEGPLQLGGAWVSGCVGWYDYSLGPPGYSREDYERCNPYGVDLRQLELCDFKGATWLCPRWWMRDCLLVKLPITHEEYVSRCVQRVSRQLQASGQPRILVYHHVPRREILPYTGDTSDFAHAYAGSTRLDEPPRRHGADLVVYGHVHERSRHRMDQIEGLLYANAYLWHPEKPGLLLASEQRGALTLEIID